MSEPTGARRARVLVRRVTDIARNVDEALDFLDYDFAGRRVWVKPNILSSQPPELSVTTAPEVVRHCVRGLKARGAAEVWVGDNPGGTFRGSMAEFAAPTGIPDASEGCFVDASLDPETLTLDSRFVPRVTVSPLLFRADVILNLPVFKTHALTLLTGAVKNLFGIIPGRQKTLLHGKARNAVQFSELLVDIFQAVPIPVLSIMDALRGMDGQSGPNTGRVRAIGRLLASPSAVALDAVMAMMAGTKPEHVPMLRIAADRRLGPARPEEIDIAGDFTRLRGFRLPATGIAHAATFVSGHYFSRVMSRPLLKPARCTECGKCRDDCPVDAIAMTPLPRIDRRSCIPCYCCVEVCPAHALVVAGSLRGLWNRLTGR